MPPLTKPHKQKKGSTFRWSLFCSIGAPGTMGSNRLRAILGSSTRRRCAPAPKFLLWSEFVERATAWFVDVIIILTY